MRTIHAQNGLSAEDRVISLQWHEMTHLGLGNTKYERAILGGNLAAQSQARRKSTRERVNVAKHVSVNEDMAR